MGPVYAEIAHYRKFGSWVVCFFMYRWTEAIYVGLPEDVQVLVHDLLECYASYLLPEIEAQRVDQPQWDHELGSFVKWLRRWARNV